VGVTCSTHGRGEKFIEFRSDNLKGIDHLQDQGVDGRIILRWISEK